MPTLRKKWNTLMQYGVGIAALSVFLLIGLVAFALIGIAVIMAKISVFIK